VARSSLEGGPKTAEVPQDFIPGDRLLQEVDISPDITLEQRKRLEEVILRNKAAFGIDGRLGNYEVKLKFP
jgi:hypothetical protein